MEKIALPGDKDHELVARALLGNQRAFREIIERHHPIAYAVVRAILGDRDDVEDVMQDIFIKVYRGLRTFRGTSKLSTWIYQIARNEAINAKKKRRPDFVFAEGRELHIPDSANPEVLYEKRRLREHLEGALSHLNEEQRVALELRYLGERSYSEIAEIMMIPIGTVKTYIYRGKAELKRIMMRDLSIHRQKGTGSL